MSKRELNISDKKLYIDTKEDIILKSPLRIPPKGIQDLINLKGVQITDYAYYDISKTENQTIHFGETPTRPVYYEIIGYTTAEGNMRMGEFNDI